MATKLIVACLIAYSLITVFVNVLQGLIQLLLLVAVGFFIGLMRTVNKFFKQ